MIVGRARGGTIAEVDAAHAIFLVSAFALGAAGCEAHATGTAKVSTGFEAHAAGEANAASSDAKPTPDQPTPRTILKKFDLKFDTDKADLTPDDKKELSEYIDDLCGYFAKNPADVVTIEGHADARAPEEHNQQLSLRRAQAVRQYILDNNKLCQIDGSKLAVLGHGEGAPRLCNEPASCVARDPEPLGPESLCRECWAQDRMTILSVSRTESMVAAAPTPPAPEPTAPPPPPAEEPRFILGLAAGVMIPAGDAQSDVAMSSRVKLVVPLEATAGVWLSSLFALGIHAHYGLALPALDWCSGQPAGCAVGASHVRAALWGEVGKRAWTGVRPWGSLGLGFESLMVTRDSSGASTSIAWGGPEAQLRGGLDWHVVDKLRGGPFVGLDVGQYGSQAGSTGAVHEWVLLGLRAMLDL